MAMLSMLGPGERRDLPVRVAALAGRCLHHRHHHQHRHLQPVAVVAGEQQQVHRHVDQEDQEVDLLVYGDLEQADHQEGEEQLGSAVVEEVVQ